MSLDLGHTATGGTGQRAVSSHGARVTSRRDLRQDFAREVKRRWFPLRDGLRDREGAREVSRYGHLIAQCGLQIFALWPSFARQRRSVALCRVRQARFAATQLISQCVGVA